MKLWARRGFEWAEEHLAGLWCPVLTGGTGSTLLDCNPSTSNHGRIQYSNSNLAWTGSQHGTVYAADGTTTNTPINLPQKYFGLSGPFAISAWINSTYTGSGAAMVMSNYNGAGGGHLMYFTGTNGLVSSFVGASNATFSGVSVNDGKWHLVTVNRINFSTLSCFIDTQNLGTQTGTFTGNPGEQGGGSPGQFLAGGFFGVPFLGQIAEIINWSKSLQFSEHQQAFQAGPGGAWQLTPPSCRYATILANAYTLIAASASYSITGQPVGLLAGRLLTADAASYLLAGNATGLNAGRLLTADSAAYALNGQDANLLASRLLSGDTATYNLIGNSANLLASRTLQADSAQYTVTGSDAALLAGRLLDCGSSAFLLSPNQAGLLAARKLTADQASILLTTQATNLYAGRKITADTAQFILIASPVDLTFGGGGNAPYYYLFLLGGSR